MRVREYLWQVRRIDKRIKALDAERVGLREAATYLPSQSTAGTGRVSNSSHSDPTADIAVKIATADKKIAAEIDALIDLRNKIRGEISQIVKAEYRLILQEHYLNFKTFEQISVDLNYSWRHIMRLYRKALIEFERIICNEQ